jgi:hypothetical protein
MKDNVARRNLTRGTKVFLVSLVVLGVIDLAFFLFWGKQLTDLVGAIGFALMAYGTYKNGNRKRPDNEDDLTFSKKAQSAYGIGLVLVVGSVIASHLL